MAFFCIIIVYGTINLCTNIVLKPKTSPKIMNFVLNKMPRSSSSLGHRRSPTISDGLKFTQHIYHFDMNLVLPLNFFIRTVINALC